MSLTPPLDLRTRLHVILEDLLQRNPAATSSESYVQNHVEFELLAEQIEPRYSLRIGINYHGAQVQHVTYDANGILVGWNPGGDALGTGARAKVLLAGTTIFPRDPNEQMMSDCKISGGNVPVGQYVRAEFKVRGWLGKTKNLDGAQLLKDFRLLRDDQADLLVVALSEVAHLKWRGEGPAHQVERRTGCLDFRKVLIDPGNLAGTTIVGQDIPQMTIQTLAAPGEPEVPPGPGEPEVPPGPGEPEVPPQHWRTSTQRVVGAPSSNMPGAEHLVTLCWRV